MSRRDLKSGLALAAVGLASTAGVLLAGASLSGEGGTEAKSIGGSPRATVVEASNRTVNPDGHGASSDPVTAARAWLDANPRLTRGLTSADFEVHSVTRGAAGTSMVRFSQVESGLAVIAGEAVVGVSAGRVTAVNVEVTRGAPEARRASVAARRARQLAIADTARRSGLRPDDPSLSGSKPTLSLYDPQLIGDPRGGSARLVWRLKVRSSRLTDVGRDVFVDARDGSIANSIQLVKAALNRRVCDANSASRDVPCLSPVRTEGQTAKGVTDVDKAYEYAGDTWDLYKGLGRDSLDGAGMAITSTVRYCGRDGSGTYRCPYANAYWDGAQMVYGAGYPRADDVVAHELTHGVTDSSSNLFYYFQSGAINEGLSDVFGEFVDLTNGSGTDTAAVRWKVGEDLSGGAIRDMSNPPAFGDPDRTGSTLYDSDPDFTDDGGVHANSGVVNKTAFLITDGGTFNGQTVAGIGLGKAIPIWYQASQLLTSGSDFRDLGEMLRQSCQSLLGTSGIVSSDCTQVDKATVATQLGVSPVKAPVTQAPICESGTPTNSWSESFESGPGAANGWVRTASVGLNRWYWASERPSTAGYSRDGKQNLWANSDDTRGDTTISMNTSVTVPAGGFLRFEHSHDFEVTDGLTADGGMLEYSTNSGVTWQDAGPLMTEGGYNGTIYAGADSTNPLAGRAAFVGNSRGYTSTRLDLGSLDGRTVRLRLRMGTDEGNMGATYGGWHVDRLRLYSCGDSAPAVSSFALSTPVAKGAVTPTRETTAAYTLSFAEPVTGLTAADFTIGGTSTGWSVGLVTGSGAGPWTVVLNGPSATDGTVTLALKAQSVQGSGSSSGPVAANPSANQLRSDRTPPTTSFSSSPGSWLKSLTASFGFTGADIGGSGVVGYECTIGAFSAGPVDPRSASDRCTNPKSFTGLAQGSHTVLGRAVDAAGNVDLSPATSTFTVDTVAPDTRITSGPSSGIRPTFGFTSSAGDFSYLECRYDSGSWFRCTSPYRRATSLSRGSHVFRVRAVDRAGNADPTPATKSFRV